MFDCLPQSTEICIPAEYRDYWNFSGSLIRTDSRKVKTDGPVKIQIVATDAILPQSVARLSKRSVAGFTIFYEMTCQTDTNCHLRIGAIPQQPEAKALFDLKCKTSPRCQVRATAPPQQLAAQRDLRIPLREIEIWSKERASMDAALRKLRYCTIVWEGCAAGPSISFSELRLP